MNDSIREICRRFRKNQTKAENAFWEVSRNRQIEGYKILRQHPIRFNWNEKVRFFIADFFCNEAKLVIEIDGGIHESQKDYDKSREQIINTLGYEVIRFPNDDVLNQKEKVIENLITKIKECINPPSLFERRG